ncbi:TPA: FliM/FliN family flagellar motor switch protein [Burkholderia cenocepacia]|uniref:FliM/FliN family flagellar motor C-terminal domain-containing protein n=1 Tax=unclassified Burkholderia TaxID=2613784 RepID=UPI00158B38F0|nr:MULTISPECIES: FliM/FliN family flagellar motor C-terminal domain-containing protein [unclassified Burkholderia]HEF5875108.1 FliM/FliN family flagellar motor switch protein [Burkholderia cenocepacia]
MTDAVFRWRPLAERDLEEAGTLSERAVAPWLHAWCDDAPRVGDVVRIAPPEPPPWSSAAHVWSCGPHLQWAIEPRTLDRLVRHALDLPDDFSVPSPGYCADVLRSFGKSMADEMADALRAICGASPPDAQRLSQPDAAKPSVSRYEGVHVRLLLGPNDACLSIVFTAPFWWTQHVPRRVAATPPATLTSRLTALESTSTRIHARLGTVALPVAQLLDLMPGDVLVIADQLDPVISVVTGHAGRTTVGLGRLGRTDRRLSIQLQSLVEPKDHR